VTKTRGGQILIDESARSPVANRVFMPARSKSGAITRSPHGRRRGRGGGDGATAGKAGVADSRCELRHCHGADTSGYRASVWPLIILARTKKQRDGA